MLLRFVSRPLTVCHHGSIAVEHLLSVEGWECDLSVCSNARHQWVVVASIMAFLNHVNSVSVF